jgi:hypothetical protein
MPEPDGTVSSNDDLLDAPAVHERSVRAAGVLQQPAAGLFFDDGVLPGNPRISEHNVSLRVAPDTVSRACLQQPVDALALNVQLLAQRGRGRATACEARARRLRAGGVSAHGRQTPPVRWSPANCRSAEPTEG